MTGPPRKDLRKTIFKVQEPHARQFRIHLPNYIAEEAGLKGGDSISYEVWPSGSIVINKVGETIDRLQDYFFLEDEMPRKEDD